MVTYRAPFSHWSDFSFAELADRSFAWLAEPSHVVTFTADMILSPVTSNDARSNWIITPQLLAYANEFAYIMSLTYKMGLMRRIEFATGEDLDDVWGKIYGVRRRYGEGDEAYRKRLQIYLLQLAGSGTKAAIEEIISIIVGRANSCRVDTYWPGYCRIYITDSLARVKARANLDLINLVLPETLAAGIDYRFYIPYYDLPADIALQGVEYLSLPASEALQGESRCTFTASAVMAKRSDVSIDADLVLGGVTKSEILADIALKDRVDTSLGASEVLSGRVEFYIAADMALQGPSEMTFKAYERVVADIHTTLDADLALQGRRLRPFEARIMLEEST